MLLFVVLCSTEKRESATGALWLWLSEFFFF